MRPSSFRPHPLVVALASLASLAVVAPTLAAQRPAPTVVQAPAPVVATTAPANEFSQLRWRMVGPARGGRVTTVTGVDQEPFTFYFGSTGGGVWKTTDAGANWNNVSDGQITVGSMGDIDVANSDPNIVYAGTGSDGLRSNVSIGKGVWKSADAGKTWKHVGLADVGNIGAVRVHPNNPNIAFVAAIGDPFRPTNARGLYRTTDGGASWQRVLFVSDSTGAVDVEFNTGDPNVLYAAMWRAERKPWTIISGAVEGGIYRSTDGGSTWTRLANGLPTGLVGKANVAVSRVDPRRVYVLIEAKPGQGLYRSDDGGDSFTLVSANPNLTTRSFYYTTLTADPTNADVLYAGAEGYYKSTDGGRTWASMRVPHGDNHDMWISPTNGQILIQSNDGGANVSLNGGRTWSTQYNQPTGEIYQVYVDDQYPYRLYGAQQDNTTLILPSLPVDAGGLDDPIQGWRTGPGCETGPIMPHRTNPDTVYGSCKGQFSRLSLRSGQEKQYWVGAQSLYGNAMKDMIYRFQRVSPMETSPHDPRVLYYGSQFVHRTRDEGANWEVISPDLTWNPEDHRASYSGGPITVDNTGEEFFSVVYAIRESALEKGVIWVGANDGPFHITRDDGKTWTNVTPRGLELGGRVQNIEPSPFRKGSAFFTVLRYQLGDWKPYIFKTDDYGKTWVNLTDGTNGIPANEPVRVVREDPSRQGLLYAGTEFGMYVSFNGGKQWQSLQLNLPNTPVTDLKVHRKDVVISTQGRAFWILHDISPLHEVSDALATGAAHLFTPRETIRYHYNSGFGGPESARDGGSDPEYPSAGANIDYWFAAAPPGEVTLEVLDAKGVIVRRFSSLASGEQRVEPSEPSMRGPMWERIGTPRIPTAAGHNRFTWDLTVAGPWDPNPARSGRGGPMIVPGTYSVRLTSGTWTATRPLVVKADPRAVNDGVTVAVMQEQLDHNIAARELVSDMARFNAELDAAWRTATGDKKAQLGEVRDVVASQPWRYGRPGLAAHVQYLYGAALRPDQKVGNDAKQRLTQLRKELTDVQAKFRRITTAM